MNGQDLVTIETLLNTARCLKRAVLDAEEALHSDEVAQYSLILAGRIGFDENQLILLEAVSLLHDIGKGGIMEIISEGRQLTRDEINIVHEHPGKGMHMLSRTKDTLLTKVGTIVSMHHERWDGGGYPYGMMGDEIPLIGRIVAVADNWSALRGNRSYRPAFSDADAYMIMARENGRKFDPRIMEHFTDAHRVGDLSN